MSNKDLINYIVLKMISGLGWLFGPIPQISPISNTYTFLSILMSPLVNLQDGQISYEEFATMMKAGTDWRKASRQYSRERFNSLSQKLMTDGSLKLENEM